MRRVDAVDVGVNRVFNQVAHRVNCAGSPIASPVTNIFPDSRIAVRIKRQGLASSASLERQGHVVVDIIGAHAHSALGLLVQLLHHDDLAVELLVQA